MQHYLFNPPLRFNANPDQISKGLYYSDNVLADPETQFVIDYEDIGTHHNVSVSGTNHTLTCQSKGTSPQVTLSITTHTTSTHYMVIYQTSTNTKDEKGCATVATHTMDIVFKEAGSFMLLCFVKSNGRTFLKEAVMEILDIHHDNTCKW